MWSPPDKCFLHIISDDPYNSPRRLSDLPKTTAGEGQNRFMSGQLSSEAVVIITSQESCKSVTLSFYKHKTSSHFCHFIQPFLMNIWYFSLFLVFGANFFFCDIFMLYQWKKITSKFHKLMCPHLYRITHFL